VFRDEEELSASADLSGAIEAALQESEFLVPRTPTSRWVNEEATRFRQLGRENQFLACLIEGEPGETFAPPAAEPPSTPSSSSPSEIIPPITSGDCFFVMACLAQRELSTRQRQPIFTGPDGLLY
jgi:hypothetical protein